MSTLPGALYLGFGFNVNADITMEARSHPLFDMDETGVEFRAGDEVYDVPANAVAIAPSQPAILEVRAYENASEYVRDLKTSAEIGGTIGGFEGKASAKYGRLCQGLSKAVVARVHNTIPAYYVDLKSVSRDNLRTDFSEAYEALPETYSAATKQKFFDFFHKYGTHFVKSVTMGGRLDYYYVYENRSDEKTQTIEAQARMAYGATVKGKGAAEWKEVNKESFQSSRISVESLPGSALDSFSAQFGEGFGDAYTDWVRLAREQPHVVAFRLAPIADIFIGDDKHEALQQAAEEFGECHIIAEATYRGKWQYPGRASINGATPDPANADFVVKETTRPTAGAGTERFVFYSRQIVVDRHTLEIRLNTAYGVKWSFSGKVLAVTGDMLADLAPYQKGEHLLVVTTHISGNLKHLICVASDQPGRDTRQPTPTQMGYFDLLRKSGAGDCLESMLVNSFTTVTGANDPNAADTGYVFVGILGGNRGRDLFIHTPKVPPPHVMASLLVPLEAEERHGKTWYNVMD